MFNEKSKKSFRPSQLYASFGIAASIAIGPLNFQAQVNLKDEWTRPSQIMPQESDNNGAESLGSPPGPETPVVGVDRGAEGGNEFTSGRYQGAAVPCRPNCGSSESLRLTPPEARAGDTGEEKGEPVATSRDGFSPLRALLTVIYEASADSEETVVVRNKIKNLLSRLAALGEQFATCPDGIEDQRLRFKLVDKIEGIEKQVRSLHESQGLQGGGDHSQDDEGMFKFLEDLQEAIFDYQIGHQTAIYEKECGSIDQDETSVLNAFRCAQGAEYRHGGRRGCLRGTRTTILDEIDLWARGFDQPTVYWLNGLAGTGKSTIAQTVAERLLADGQLGASFFCSRDFEDRSNHHFIFPTIAVQLARRYTKFRSVFIPLVRSDPGIAYESLYNQMKKLIVRPLVESAVSTTIVIDALDECKDEEPASVILSVLGQFVSEIPNVKFFLTGRPERRILEGFRLPLLASVTDVFVLHGVEPSQVDTDIRLFFRQKFSELAGRQCGLDDWPSEEQLDLLCERTAGLFVYAVATFRFIDHKNNNPKKQLDRLLQAPKSSTLEGKTKFNTNKTLDSLYLSILQEAFEDNDTEDDLKVRSILGAVVLAANPLSPFTIATLLSFDVEDILPPLSSAHSLLILHEDSHQPVRPFHKSFPDFIIDPARCTNQRFRISPPDHHAELLVGCLGLLDRKLERNMCGLPDGVVNYEVDDLDGRAEQHIDRALQYACRFWYKHLVEMTPARRGDITSALRRFLERKFLFWLEVLSILGDTREAINALETAAKWLDASPTLDLVKDCSRFVVTFFEVIYTSAPHIYHSALLLSPRTSIVRKLYESYTRPLARIVRGLPMSWEPTVATMCTYTLVAAVAWSPCGRFIAFARSDETMIEILDAKTLYTHGTLTSPLDGTRWLSFSPDGCMLTQFNDKLEVASWDLQTGGPIDVTPSDPYAELPQCFSSTYSTDGEIIAVAYRDLFDPSVTVISTYDLISRAHIYSHPAPEGHTMASVWTHGKRLRFATVKPGYITIWEVEFTSIHALTEMETFPVPGEISHLGEIAFLPAPTRLAFTIPGAVLVWDAQDSRLLLNFECYGWHREIAFSNDGRFFVCATGSQGIRVWKEAPAGYILHQELVFSSLGRIRPFFSPNGESIVISHFSAIHLWHTTDPTSPSSSISNQFVYSTNFLLEFSPDETLAAVARLNEKVVTILDLESGEARLTIDAGMEVLGLRVGESTVVVVGEGKVVTWNHPARQSTPNLRVDISDSIRTTMFYYPVRPCSYLAPYASISADLGRIAISVGAAATFTILNIYDASTGKHLAGTRPCERPGLFMPWFTPDGREVWSHCIGDHDERTHGCTILEGDESGLIELDPIEPDASPSGGFPWQQSRNYEITDNWWISSPDGMGLLWLPPSWRSDGMNGAWGVRYLGLLHGTLPEAVILEFPE